MSEVTPIYAWIVQTTEEANQILLAGGKIIIISETVPDYLSSPQYGTSCLVANDLLPDYQAVEMYINGGIPDFSARYFAMLDSRMDCRVYFATILAAIVNSIPLGFVFGTEQIERDSMIEILRYLELKFGIMLGHLSPLNGEPPIATGLMTTNYIGQNFIYLYMNNLLTPDEFLTIYPVQYPIPLDVINKLAAELQPVVRDPYNIQCYVEYFEGIRQLMAKSKKPLIDPLMR